LCVHALVHLLHVLQYMHVAVQVVASGVEACMFDLAKPALCKVNVK